MNSITILFPPDVLKRVPVRFSSGHRASCIVHMLVVDDGLMVVVRVYIYIYVYI